MNEQEFLEETKKLNLSLNEDQLFKLKEYAKFLIEYNKKVNITAIKTIEETYLKHFYDSLTITREYTFQNQQILDIGTGGGFPGLVLAICFPNLTVHLLDSNHKKIDFLNQLIQKLKITNAKTIYERSEIYATKKKEMYDVITSRAVADLRVLMEISFPLLKTKGIFLAMKSICEEEIKDARDTIEILHGKLIQAQNFELPKNAGTRCIIKIQKEKETEKTYPRSYATIMKKPLKKKQF